MSRSLAILCLCTVYTVLFKQNITSFYLEEKEPLSLQRSHFVGHVKTGSLCIGSISFTCGFSFLNVTEAIRGVGYPIKDSRLFCPIGISQHQKCHQRTFKSLREHYTHLPYIRILGLIPIYIQVTLHWSGRVKGILEWFQTTRVL